MATLNQNRVFERVKDQVRKGEKVSVSKAMRGIYAPSVAKKPGKVTETKSWKELMDKYLPESKLAEEHDNLLNQTRVEYFTFPKAMGDDDIRDHVESAGLKVITINFSDKGKLAFYSVADAQAKKAALDMAYKLRGVYEDTKNGASKTLIVSGNNISFDNFDGTQSSS